MEVAAHRAGDQDGHHGDGDGGHGDGVGDGRHGHGDAGDTSEAGSID